MVKYIRVIVARTFVNLVIKKSKIAGKGVFTTTRILKGKRICFLTGKLYSLEDMLEFVRVGKEAGSDPLGVDDEKYLDLDELPRSMNHSCNPKAFIRGKNELIALRNIAAGSEITYDYSTTMNDNKQKINAAGQRLWTCRCNCGSKICRGKINQFKTLPLKRQVYYIRNRYAPDFILKAFKDIV